MFKKVELLVRQSSSGNFISSWNLYYRTWQIGSELVIYSTAMMKSHSPSLKIDILSSENLRSCNLCSVTEENDDVETENNDGHEDIYRTEDTAEYVKNTSTLVKKQISKPPLNNEKT
jgi:hypothetical protein